MLPHLETTAFSPVLPLRIRLFARKTLIQMDDINQQHDEFRAELCNRSLGRTESVLQGREDLSGGEIAQVISEQFA